MTMKSIYALLSLFVLCALSIDDASAQKKELKRARGFYEDGEYYQSLFYYDSAEELGGELTLDDEKNKARSYYYLNDIDNAYVAFQALESSLTGEDVFIYASTIHQFGLYEDAITWYEKAKTAGANTLHVNDLIESCRWAMANGTQLDYRVNPCFELATQGQSFGVQYYLGNQQVVYSSASDNSRNVDRYGNPFLNLYTSDLENGEVVENTKRSFSKKLQSKYHVGAICFTSDYKYIYYTKSVVVDDYDIMKIFVSEFDGKDWVNERALTINSDDYDCAHPALTPDDKYLYFVSNREDIGYGGKDIYYVERIGPNEFGDVVNAGSTINTYADEVYPILSKDNKLYFSSNGHYGFGGLDIFVAENVDGKWQNVKNMMKPFNTNHDDFCYIIDPENPDRGFLSSNNYGTNDADVIFTVRVLTEEDKNIQVEDMPPIMGMETLIFNQEELEAQPDEELTEPATETIEMPIEEPVIEEPVIEQTVAVGVPHPFSTEVTSTFNGTKISGAQVTISDASTGDYIGSAHTDKQGRVTMNLDGNKVNDKGDYNVTVKKDGFKPKSFLASLEEIDDLKNTGIQLTPMFNSTVLEDIGGLVIPYTDSLTPEAKLMLDKLAAYLIQNPSIVIKLNAHTEAKGIRYKNLSISQKMAEKAQEYLISQGVNGDQVIPRGYGERYLLNRCHRGKYCDKAQHLENRRIEVVVWDVRK